MKFIYTITDFSSCGLPAPLSNVHNSLSYCYWMRLQRWQDIKFHYYYWNLHLWNYICWAFCWSVKYGILTVFSNLAPKSHNLIGWWCWVKDVRMEWGQSTSCMRKTVHSVQSVVWSVTHLVAGVTHTHSVSSHGEVPGERFRRRFLVRVRVHVLTLRQDSEIHHKFHHRLSNGKVININVQINKWTVRHELSMWVKIVVFSSSFVQKDVHITFSKETKGKWNVSE